MSVRHTKSSPPILTTRTTVPLMSNSPVLFIVPFPGSMAVASKRKYYSIFRLRFSMANAMVVFCLCRWARVPRRQSLRRSSFPSRSRPPQESLHPSTPQAYRRTAGTAGDSPRQFHFQNTPKNSKKPRRKFSIRFFRIEISFMV